MATTVGVLALVGCAAGGNTSGDSLARGPNTLPSSATPFTASSTAPTRTSTPTTTLAAMSPGASVAPAPSAPSSGSCHERGTGVYVLPDASCTPGATFPAVTQANIGLTICSHGWTSTVRPPESYTEPLKYQQIAAYGDTGAVSDYEEDHLIPLELGGSPTSPQNLWPEPGASPNPKDAVENAANRAVCDGRMTLATAQQAIAANWIALGRQLGAVPAAEPPVTSAGSPSG